jgi:Ca2+-transporting ATPase
MDRYKAVQEVDTSSGSASMHWRGTYPRLSTLEFDRKRKLMSVCCRDSSGNSLIFTKGAPEEVLKRCSTAIDKHGQGTLPVNEDAWKAVLERWCGERALRCIALAYSLVPGRREEITPEDEQKLVLLGVVGLEDAPRPEASRAVQDCASAGIRVVMLTGVTPLLSCSGDCCGTNYMSHV